MTDHQTLKPIVTETVETRQHPSDTEPDTRIWCESNYAMEETDSLWIGLSGMTLQRGSRYSGVEETLRVNNYSGEMFGDAVLDLVAEMKRQADPGSGAGEFCRCRAVAFLDKLRAAVAPPVTLPGETSTAR